MISSPKSLDGSRSFRRPSLRQMREKISSIRKSIQEFKQQHMIKSSVFSIQVEDDLKAKIGSNIKQLNPEMKKKYTGLSSSRTSYMSQISSIDYSNPQEREQSIKSSQKSARLQIGKIKKTIKRIKEKNAKNIKVELVPVVSCIFQQKKDDNEKNLKISESHTTISKAESIQQQFKTENSNLGRLKQKLQPKKPKSIKIKKPVDDKSMVIGMLIIYSIIFIMGMLFKQ